MFLKATLIIIIVFLNFNCVNLSCVDYGSGNVFCNHIGSAFTKNSEAWVFLSIYNEHKEHLVPLSKTSLENIKQLEELVIDESINYIEPDTFDKLKAEKIVLVNNKIPFIDSRSFYSKFTKTLYLRHNDFLYFPRSMFGQSTSLIHITINEEKIPAVRSGIFDALTNLEELNLANNEITLLQKKAFDDLPSIRVLNLARNKIEEFDSESLFSNNNLERLVLNRNNLTGINLGQLSNLVHLDLSHNFITVLKSDLFKTSRKLAELYLNNNQLTHISSFHLPASLGEISISYNNLTDLQINFERDFPKMKRISVVGNPWQCPCWFNLRKLIHNAHLTELSCAYEFLNGKYPVCVVHEDSKMGCVYTGMYNREYSSMYYEGLADADVLPVCGPP